MADWDERYGSADVRLFGERPNEYVREVLARSDFRAESVLCLGDGDGRNGGWLAEQGLAVSAVDISAVATEQALAHDRARGVTVERIVADLAEWQPPAGRTWDAVFLIYLQCESAVRTGAVRRAAAALPAGGWFVAEGFARSGAAEDGLGPKAPDLLYDLDELTAALPGFRIAEAFEGTVWLSEGKRHEGAARVVRLAAQRPEGQRPAGGGAGGPAR